MHVDDTTLGRRPPWTVTYFNFLYSHRDENRGETYEVLISHLLIKLGNFIHIARSEWLKAGISTKIMLLADRFQGRVHLLHLTYAMDDSSELLTIFEFSEKAVLTLG